MIVLSGQICAMYVEKLSAFMSYIVRQTQTGCAREWDVVDNICT